MSPAASIIARATAAGITLEARGDRLRFDAPHGLPPDLRTDLVEHKAEVLALLVAEPTPPPFDPVDWSADDCPAWCFDDSLTVSLEDIRRTVAECSYLDDVGRKS
jgi:hypothetical protein